MADGPWVETLKEPPASRAQGAVQWLFLSLCRELAEQFVSRVAGVFQDSLGLRRAPGGINVIECFEGFPHNALGRFYHPLQWLQVLFGAVSEP